MTDHFVLNCENLFTHFWIFCTTVWQFLCYLHFTVSTSRRIAVALVSLAWRKVIQREFRSWHHCHWQNTSQPTLYRQELVTSYMIGLQGSDLHEFTWSAGALRRSSTNRFRTKWGVISVCRKWLTTLCICISVCTRIWYTYSTIYSRAQHIQLLMKLVHVDKQVGK
jgi:hypothetical protein